MDYVTLANGVKMPQLGYGVYQVTKEECERCVLDALEVGYRALIQHKAISMKQMLAKLSLNLVLTAKKSF